MLLPIGLGFAVPGATQMRNLVLHILIQTIVLQGVGRLHT